MSLTQTFDLKGCRTLLTKLRWEIDQIRQDDGSDHSVLACRGFNAAVTAWHLADWIWEDMTEDQRAAVGVSNKKDLQTKARNECRAIHYCRQIATASKHFVVRKHHDPNILAQVSGSARMTVSEGEN